MAHSVSNIQLICETSAALVLNVAGRVFSILSIKVRSSHRKRGSNNMAPQSRESVCVGYCVSISDLATLVCCCLDFGGQHQASPLIKASRGRTSHREHLGADYRQKIKAHVHSSAFYAPLWGLFWFWECCISPLRLFVSASHTICDSATVLTMPHSDYSYIGLAIYQEKGKAVALIEIELYSKWPDLK